MPAMAPPASPAYTDTEIELKITVDCWVNPYTLALDIRPSFGEGHTR